MRGSQLFATPWLGLFETPITADKKASLRFVKIAFGNFFHPQYVIRNWLWDNKEREVKGT